MTLAASACLAYARMSASPSSSAPVSASRAGASEAAHRSLAHVEVRIGQPTRERRHRGRRWLHGCAVDHA
jgi:hypothetical protein